MSTSRELWDRLNDMQAELWRAGRGDSPEYQQIVTLMEPLTPPGYGGGRPVQDHPSMTALRRAARAVDGR